MIAPACLVISAAAVVPRCFSLLRSAGCMKEEVLLLYVLCGGWSAMTSAGISHWNE